MSEREPQIQNTNYADDGYDPSKDNIIELYESALCPPTAEGMMRWHRANAQLRFGE